MKLLSCFFFIKSSARPFGSSSIDPLQLHQQVLAANSSIKRTTIGMAIQKQVYQIEENSNRLTPTWLNISKSTCCVHQFLWKTRQKYLSCIVVVILPIIQQIIWSLILDSRNLGAASALAFLLGRGWGRAIKHCFRPLFERREEKREASMKKWLLFSHKSGPAPPIHKWHKEVVRAKRGKEMKRRQDEETLSTLRQSNQEMNVPESQDFCCKRLKRPQNRN